MYGVIIESGPKNWQILQQENGFAEVSLAGSVVVEPDVSAYDDAVVIARVIEENTNARKTEPAWSKPVNGRWEVKLKLPAGGPYRIETYLRYNKVWEKRGDRRFHIGVGDVYVITGQSNAVGVGKDAINDPVSFDVHMFRVSGQWDIASHPLHDGTATLFPLSQESTQTGHSPWLNFAKVLSRNLGYPIGLIPATIGGIPLSTWDREEDGVYFNNMLDIVREAQCGVKGIIWYQGCNDTGDQQLRDTYLQRFKRVCRDFENVFYDGIPILTVQLNKITCTKDLDVEEQGRIFAEMRETQRQAAHEINNVFMIPTIDLMVCDGIHNSSMSNLVIGERVANMALRYVYGKNVICDAPDIEKILVGGRTARLYFKNVYDRIFADYNQTEKLMFSLSDEKGKMLPVDYDCPGDNSIILVFEREIFGKAVVSCDGYNDTGLMPYDMFTYLPVIPFCDQIATTGEEGGLLVSQ